MALLDDGVVQWLASVRLFDAGEGDPVITDHGLDWYSAIAWAWAAGTPSYSSSGRTHLEYLEGIGLVCRPSLVLQDTRKSHYTFHAAADWDEVRLGTGSPRKYRLIQTNTTANLTWWAKSTFNLPADPHVAFSFISVDTPSDHDATVNPPYVRVELGGDSPTWGLEFSKTDGARLVRWWNNQWIEAASFPEPQGLGIGDNEERMILLRVMRGQICISTDRGKTYTRFQYPDGTAATIPAGKYIVRGTGGMTIFGLHQLTYQEGTWDSPTRNAAAVRLLPPAVSFAKRSYEPAGTVAALDDLSVPDHSIAQWRATLTPHSSVGLPFNFHTTPELYAVWMNYAIIRTTPTLAYTTPWDDALKQIRISKPRELDQGSITWDVRADPATPFVYGGRWRKVAVILTELLDDGSTGDTATFAAYIQVPSAEQAQYGEMPLSFTAENATIRAKRMKWNDLRGIPPLGGMTANQALDICLDRMGLTVAYRNWHVLGDLTVLPAGTPEDPAFWYRDNDPVWEGMTEIASYCGLELFTDDLGVFTTLPKNYVDPVVSKTWDLTPATDLKELVLSVRFSTDAMENCTAVLVRAQDEWGNAIFGYAIDGPAEADTSNPRFTPWRESETEDVQFPITPAMASGRAAFLALDQVVPKFIADVEGPADLTLSRRDRAQILNSSVGIDNANEFGIETLDHTWTALDEAGDIRTTAGLRRIGG